MNLEKALAKEHSKAQCERIVGYIGGDPERFAALMGLFFRGEYRITQRASWPMSYCVQNHPELVIPYYRQLIEQLERKDTHTAVTRNILRLLQDLTIPEEFQGRVMNACFDFILEPGVPVAIKAFSLTVLENLSLHYPEILPELKIVIESEWDRSTAAFRSRARKILSKL